MNSKTKRLGDPFVKTQARLALLSPEQAHTFEHVILARLDDFLDAAYLETLYQTMTKGDHERRSQPVRGA